MHPVVVEVDDDDAMVGNTSGSHRIKFLLIFYFSGSSSS